MIGWPAVVVPGGAVKSGRGRRCDIHFKIVGMSRCECNFEISNTFISASNVATRPWPNLQLTTGLSASLSTSRPACRLEQCAGNVPGPGLSVHGEVKRGKINIKALRPEHIKVA